MTDYLADLLAGLQTYQQGNRPPAVETPANGFEQSVNQHYELAGILAKVKDLLKPVEAAERKLRDGIAQSLQDFYGDDLKEGVNDYELTNGRKLKYTYKVDRKIDAGLVEVARAKYDQAADRPDKFTFDALLRVKYELDAKQWKQLATGGPAYMAASEMLVAKPAAPTLVVD